MPFGSMADLIASIALNFPGSSYNFNSADFKVFIRFEGACKTCNVNQMTLKLGVEEAVKKHAPEVHSVETID